MDNFISIMVGGMETPQHTLHLQKEGVTIIALSNKFNENL
jgi:hypothetical protein